MLPHVRAYVLAAGTDLLRWAAAYRLHVNVGLTLEDAAFQRFASRRACRGLVSRRLARPGGRLTRLARTRRTLVPPCVLGFGRTASDRNKGCDCKYQS